jgi:hypothetical protein
MKSTNQIDAPKFPQTVASDESVCALAELVNNGTQINWEYWLERTEITPAQAAKLAFCIDPVEWLDGDAQGKLSKDLRVKVQRLEEILSERNRKWTLPALVKELGDECAPFTMRIAVHAMAENIGAGGMAKNKTPEERRARMKKRKGELISLGVRAWQQQLAKEEGISTARVREIMKQPKTKNEFPGLAAYRKK